MLKITYKAPSAAETQSSNLGEFGFHKVFGTMLPKSDCGAEEYGKIFKVFSNARKYRTKVLKALAKKWEGSPSYYKKCAKSYLSSKRGLLAAIVEDNARRKLEDRLSLQEMYNLAIDFDVLKCLDEPATVVLKPKSSGFGTRPITAFGPVARAAQRMVAKLLRLTYQPQDFQFTHLSHAQKVQMAMSLIKQKGYSHVREIDIISYYPSFTDEKLTAVLPLPKEAVTQIILARNAQWELCKGYNNNHMYIPAPPGIPQGSASSSEVALWCVAQMALGELNGAILINHADNFFILATSAENLETASKALSSAIAGLPGGHFDGAIKQDRLIADGFNMLGFQIFPEDGALICMPTATNFQKLEGLFRITEQRAYAALLAAAHEEDSKFLRIQGLQEYLRLESILNGWLAAFAICGDQLSCVKDDLVWHLDMLANTYLIDTDQLKPLKDASTTLNVQWYSGA